MIPCPAPARSRLVRCVLWPLRLVHHIWTSAVVDERAVRFNLRLLTALTALFSLPDIAQGSITAAQASWPGARAYGVYVLVLGLLELAGALLLARRLGTGCWLIGIAAVGFYGEVILGLSGFERGLLALLIFAACIPAEAWVLWFLTHARVRAHVRAWRNAR